MCGKSSSGGAASGASTNQNATTNLTQPASVSYTAEMRMDDYFFLDPLFIIGMLVLLVIIVIIVSWWLERRKKLEELRAHGHGSTEDLEKDQGQGRHLSNAVVPPSTKVRTVEITEKNLEVLEGLLNTVGATEGDDEEEFREAESLLDVTQKRRTTLTFGPSTKIEDGSNFGESLELDEGGDPEGGPPSDKIITIIPDVDFRDFPKTEEDRMKMRRANMKKMLSLPPLS